MRINADFTQRVVVHPGDVAWTPSPMTGVERRMLDRIGGEVARATSLVRYAPGSRFSAHVHGGGEEFLVLEGVFSDEQGDYPPGTYVRNPIGSRHAPHSAGGCTIFVKLHQFDAQDAAQKVLRPDPAAFRPCARGVSERPLHAFRGERVALMRLASGATCAERRGRGGAEILVLDGAFEDEHSAYEAGAWLRTPHGLGRMSSARGALLFVKTGHLPPTV